MQRIKFDLKRTFFIYNKGMNSAENKGFVDYRNG